MLKYLKNKLCSIHLLHIGKLNNPSSAKQRLLRHKYKQNYLVFVATKSKRQKKQPHTKQFSKLFFIILFEVRRCIIFIFYLFMYFFYYFFFALSWQLAVGCCWGHISSQKPKSGLLSQWFTIINSSQWPCRNLAGIKQFSLHLQWWQGLHGGCRVTVTSFWGIPLRCCALVLVSL